MIILEVLGAIVATALVLAFGYVMIRLTEEWKRRGPWDPNPAAGDEEGDDDAEGGI